MASFKCINIIEDRTGNVLLSGINGFVPFNGILAIVGGSGSGKSLFMKSMAGLTHDCCFEGEVCLKGSKLKFGDFDETISYNEYSDTCLSDNLSPFEILTFRAYLTGNYGQRVDDIILNLLSNFYLVDVRESSVSPWLKAGLSESKIRCLNIARDLVSPAEILLFDDVLSGLDSLMTYDILNKLRTTQKEQNFSIILSINQPTPRILEMFDQVLILGVHREMSFFGSTADLQNFIGKIDRTYFTIRGFEISPVDYFLNLIYDQHDMGANIGDDHHPHRSLSYGSLFKADPSFADLMETLKVKQHNQPTMGTYIALPSLFRKWTQQ